MRELPITKAAGIGLIYGNSILLGKRIYKWKNKPIEFGGYWSIFGGAIEPGESEAGCAIRELYEETGIKIDNHQLIPSKTIEHDKSIFTIFFARTHSMPNVFLNEEHLESGWFSLDVIESFPYLIDNLVLDCIIHYRDYLMED